MTYMQGANQQMLEGVTRVTQLLNQLTEEDYGRLPHAYLKVQLVDDQTGQEVYGYWIDEHGPGEWSYFDGAPPNRKEDRHVEQ